MGVFEVLCGDLLAVSSQINIAELLAVARSQEESIVSRFEADVLSVIADTLTQAGTAARWERHGIGAQELAMHLLDTSAGVKSATGNLSDYKRRMALAIRIVVMGANGVEMEDRGRDMKIAVVGATGATGRRVVKHALAQGHFVTAVARHPERLSSCRPAVPRPRRCPFPKGPDRCS